MIKVALYNNHATGFVVYRPDGYGMSIRWGKDNYAQQTDEKGTRTQVEVAIIDKKGGLVDPRAHDSDHTDTVWGYLDAAAVFSFIPYFLKGEELRLTIMKLDMGVEIVATEEIVQVCRACHGDISDGHADWCPHASKEQHARQQEEDGEVGA